jgi:hypothetical protein
MDKLYIALAIQKLRPGVGFAMDGADYTNIIWNADNVQPITAQEIEDTLPIVIAKEEAKAQFVIDSRQSALDKLAKLGLTPDEITHLLGV